MANVPTDKVVKPVVTKPTKIKPEQKTYGGGNKGYSPTAGNRNKNTNIPKRYT